MSERTFDHERLDVYRLSIAYVPFPKKIATSRGGSNRKARDQWLCAAQSMPQNSNAPEPKSLANKV